MKKRIKVVSFTLLLLFLFTITASAASTPTIKVGTAEALPGDTVVVDVRLVDNPGINTFTFSFDYDESKLTLENVALSTGLGGQLVYGKKAVWFNNRNTTYSGKILSLTFTVDEDAPVGYIPVTVVYGKGDISNYDEEDVDFAVVAGKVTVKSEECSHAGGKADCVSKAVCKYCGEEYGDINKNNHKSVVTEKAVASTCYRTGLTEGKHCTACDTVIKEQTVTAVKAHRYSSVVTPATCKTQGYTTHTCQYCKTGYTDSFTAKAKHIDIDENNKCDKCYVIIHQIGKVTGLKAKKTESSYVTLSWKSVPYAQKYTVYYSTDGKKWKTASTSKTSVTVKKLKSGQTYRFKVKAVAGDTAGAESAVIKAVTKVAKVSLKSLKSAKTGQLTVTWAKTSGASGYQVEYSTSKKFTKKTTKTTLIKKSKTVKTTLKKLKKGKKYYVRVKAYKTVSGKKVFGAYSTVKNVKVK